MVEPKRNATEGAQRRFGSRIWRARVCRERTRRLPAVLGLGLLLILHACGEPPAPSLELSDLDGTNGVTLRGTEGVRRAARNATSAGDVNGDGIDDVILGAPLAEAGIGHGYVVFGKRSGFDPVLPLSSLDGTNGFVLRGALPNDQAGLNVAGAGDVNGDGVDDVIVGAPAASPGGIPRAGESYVVFGSPSGFDATVSLASLDGKDGFVLRGFAPYGLSGYRVACAGDVNGDGVDDVIVAAHATTLDGVAETGQIHVVFGSRSPFEASLELHRLDGRNGFTLNGFAPGGRAGRSVASAGDVNTDGIDDLIIGAPRASPGGRTRAGESYVVFGSRRGFEASFELSALDGSNGFVMPGRHQYDFAGGSVSGAGDVNGDGVDDLIVGAQGADPDGRAMAGHSYVVFGRRSGFPAILELPAPGDEGSGLVLEGIEPGDKSGYSVAGVGDFDGDGLGDLIVGAYAAAPGGRKRAGASYLVFGRRSAFGGSLKLASLDGRRGFVLNGIAERDASARSVASAGDFNGDGLDDVVIGAFGADADGARDVGEAYVVFGRERPRRLGCAAP